MNINIITTAKRRVLYIDKMMESLKASGYSGHVSFIAGCKEIEYLTPYVSMFEGSEIIVWDMKNIRPRLDVVKNHSRAMKHGSGPVLICEDDVLFVKDWQTKLENIIKQIPEPNYLLDIGKLNVQKNIPCKNLIPWGQKGSGLQGSWGLYYSSQKVRDKIAHDLCIRHDGCNDVIIGKIAKENFYLYVSPERLVEHIGAVSTF